MRCKYITATATCLAVLSVSPSFAQHIRTVNITDTVTRYQLGHHVPAQASREFASGMKALYKDRAEDALVHLTKAITIDPDFHAAVNNLGVAYFAVDRFDLAVGQFERAVAIDPHQSVGYFNLAIANVALRDFKAGEAAARQGLRLDCSSRWGMLALGMSLVLQNRFTSEAIASLRKATAEFVQATFWLGYGLYNTGDMEAAKDQLTAFLRSTDSDGAISRHAAALIREIERAARNPQSGSETAVVVETQRSSSVAR